MKRPKWIGEDGEYRYKLEQQEDGTVDLKVFYLTSTHYHWFDNYRQARDFLRREYHFKGRLRRVENKGE